MRNIDDIRKNLASYKSVMKKQGDFTLYASKYIQDVESLLGMVEGKPATQKAPGVAPTVRKKKKITKSDTSAAAKKD